MVGEVRQRLNWRDSLAESVVAATIDSYPVFHVSVIITFYV